MTTRSSIIKGASEELIEILIDTNGNVQGGQVMNFGMNGKNG